MAKQLVEIGTSVVINYGVGCGRAFGQVIGYNTDEFGTEHIAIIDGQVQYLSNVWPSNHRGIGARIATAEEMQDA